MDSDSSKVTDATGPWSAASSARQAATGIAGVEALVRFNRGLGVPRPIYSTLVLPGMAMG